MNAPCQWRNSPGARTWTCTSANAHVHRHKQHLPHAHGTLLVCTRLVCRFSALDARPFCLHVSVAQVVHGPCCSCLLRTVTPKRTAGRRHHIDFLCIRSPRNIHCIRSPRNIPLFTFTTQHCTRSPRNIHCIRSPRNIHCTRSPRNIHCIRSPRNIHCIRSPRNIVYVHHATFPSAWPNLSRDCQSRVSILCHTYSHPFGRDTQVVHVTCRLSIDVTRRLCIGCDTEVVHWV